MIGRGSLEVGVEGFAAGVDGALSERGAEFKGAFELLDALGGFVIQLGELDAGRRRGEIFGEFVHRRMRARPRAV